MFGRLDWPIIRFLGGASGNAMIDRIVVEDPFRGISIGSLVRIIDGPKDAIGKDALVVDRFVIGYANEDMHEEYDANFEVMTDGRRIRLWVGWVERILD